MRPNIVVQIFSVLLLGLLVLAMAFEPWNRMVDQMDTQLRQSFFGLAKSYSIEHEATTTIREAYAEIHDGYDSNSDPFTRLPDFYRIQAWILEMDDRVIYRAHRTLCRIATILELFPVGILLLTALGLDGMQGRSIKQLRFDYPSPLRHRVSLSLLLALMTIMGLLVLSPLPFAPEEVFLGGLLLSYLMNMHLLNLPKRL